MPRHYPTRPPFRARPFAPALSRLSLALLLVGASPCRADGPYTYVPADAAPAPQTPADSPALPGTFVTALAQDPQGRVIVATEGTGVWRLEPTSGQYAHFTQQDTNGGLACDDVYALAVDSRQRLWAGTRAGLSVYSGLAWRTYGPAEGLAGSRVSALAVCPKDGDVWAATEGGLTRYSLHHGTWTTYSRADGLPADALSCLAFDPQGNLYAGTQADGVAAAARENNYARWRVARGPARAPSVPDGAGLPSSLVNCLLVGRDGSVYAGTDGGLARSRDGGRHWRFLRGADWAALARGGGAAPEETWDAGDRMSETYVTALAEDGQGRLLVGHRRTGLDVFDEATGRLVPAGSAQMSVAGTDYVTSILPRRDGRAAVGFYGGGLATFVGQTTGQSGGRDPEPAPPLPLGRLPALPAPAAPPTLAQLNALLARVRRVAPDPSELQPHVVTLADDWQTRGDWLGRYGRYWACLCAVCSPSDYLWGAGWEPVHYAALIGPDRDKGDGPRYFVTWLYTDDPRVLELPPPYLDSRIERGLTTPALPRREAEIDDHGEAYDTHREGPGIFLTVTVPPGLYTLSLYETNKSGHDTSAGDGADRDRDYRLSIRPHDDARLADLTGFPRAPEWAHGRVYQFWGGVWKRFLVRGPAALDVRVERNHSRNAILQGATLDLVDEMPPPYAGTPESRLAWRNAQRERLLARWRSAHAQGVCRPGPARSAPQAADALLDALQGMQFTNSRWWGAYGPRFYAPLLRWYAARAAGDPKNRGLLSCLGTCEYRLGLYRRWEDCEREAGVTPARDVEKALRFDGTNGMGRGFVGHGFEAISTFVKACNDFQPKKTKGVIPLLQQGRTE